MTQHVMAALSAAAKAIDVARASLRGAAQPGPDLNAPVEQAGTVTVEFLGAMPGGDDTWFPLAVGDVPLNIATKIVSNQFRTRVVIKPSRLGPDRFTVAPADSEEADEVPVRIKVTLKKARAKRA